MLLNLLFFQTNKKKKIIPVDTVVVCAGQEPRSELADQIKKMDEKVILFFF